MNFFLFIHYFFLLIISFILHLTKSGIMLYPEIQRGKAERPKWSEQYRELGATTSCSLRATAKMANCGQKIEEHYQNLILADSWFSSVKTAEAIHESGHDWIGVV
jgi:hypothetical protein